MTNLALSNPPPVQSAPQWHFDASSSWGHEQYSYYRHGSVHETDSAEDVDDGTITQLLEKYAPVIKLSSVEAFFPSSIEYMLPHYNYSEGEPGDITPLNQTLLTPSLLDTLPSLGSGLYLSIVEPHNPQPLLLDDESAYLFGPYVWDEELKARRSEQAVAAARKGEDDRGKVEEPVYGFGVDQGRGIVDLWYWTFYPFNYGKPIGPFGVLGNHVGDWEHLRMRTVNGAPVSADFTTHTGGRFSAGTFRWEDIEKIDGRPVAYAAAGSHGIWPDPGDHVYANVGKVFKLVDITDDEGPIWDTKSHVVPAVYWDNPRSRRKLRHTGDKRWMNFRGIWGNRGETNCWWHKVVGYCQLVDAPWGPNRNFGVPPDCTIAPLSDEASSYSFHLAPLAIEWAKDHGITLVQVEQVCTRPKKGNDDDDGDGPDDYDGFHDEEDGYAQVEDGDGGDVEIWDDAVEGKLEVWTVKGMTDFKGSKKHVVTLNPCKGVRSAVRAYKLSLCLPHGKCISTSNERRVCTYSPEDDRKGKKGYTFGSAVQLEDVDDWRWNF